MFKFDFWPGVTALECTLTARYSKDIAVGVGSETSSAGGLGEKERKEEEEHCKEHNCRFLIMYLNFKIPNKKKPTLIYEGFHYLPTNPSDMRKLGHAK